MNSQKFIPHKIRLDINPITHFCYFRFNKPHLAQMYCDVFLTEGYYIRNSYTKKRLFGNKWYYVTMSPGRKFWENKIELAMKLENYEAIKMLERKLTEAKTVKF